MPRAILSVSDKTGVVELARGLVALGWELVSTGGTARALRDAGLAVKDVSEVTGHPEMMDGRIKTLHPAVHAGILARRERSDDLEAMAAHGYTPVDLVVVNLYPFRETVAAGAKPPEAIEQIDIGGPTMLRAAAKNHEHVLVVVDPADYGDVLSAIRGGEVERELRWRLAAKVFEHTASYDGAIAAYMQSQSKGTSSSITESTEFPARLQLDLQLVQALRYGENPDQPAAFYAEPSAPAGSLPRMRQLQGKELSFNNLLDADAAVLAISAWRDAATVACAIIKHTTPCGLAIGGDVLEAYNRALACDPVSAFGGIVSFNAPVDSRVAELLAEQFLELIVAPKFEAGAVEILGRKKNLRLIELPLAGEGSAELDFKRVRGGLLAQRRMSMTFAEDAWQVAGSREPDTREWVDLRFAWRVVAAVKSNAIVLARDGRTIGIGAGQMSRVDSSRLAVLKARDQGHDVAGAVLASDAFFPFRDGVDEAATAGVTAIIQPGGSVRDAEVIAAANEHGIAMVLTGRRVFRH